MNEADGEGGGFYRFSDGDALQTYLDGPIVAGVAGHSALTNVQIKVFDNIERLSEITRGPVFSSAA